MTIMEIKKRINVKRKGNNGELKFSEWLNSNGIKSSRDSASGGGNREKSDIQNGINAHFEVKTVKAINILKVWKKALIECEKTHNTPYICIHFDGMKDNKWLMVMDSDDWLDLILKEKEDKIQPQFTQEDDRQKKWKIQSAITALKNLLKEYESY